MAVKFWLLLLCLTCSHCLELNSTEISNSTSLRTNKDGSRQGCNAVDVSVLPIILVLIVGASFLISSVIFWAAYSLFIKGTIFNWISYFKGDEEESNTQTNNGWGWSENSMGNKFGRSTSWGQSLFSNFDYPHLLNVVLASIDHYRKFAEST